MTRPNTHSENLNLSAAQQVLLTVFQAALSRVEGQAAVAAALATDCPAQAAILAVGKAADAMARGAVERLGDGLVQGLIVTKYGHGHAGYWAGCPVRFLESAHPVPDGNSLVAGRAVVDFVANLPPGIPLICLISGGASSLVELPREGVDLPLLQRASDWLLGSGLDIHGINRVRQGLSQLKGGGLLSLIGERPLLGLYISDVAGDDPAVIGSGLLGPSPHTTLPEDLPDWLETALQPVVEPNHAVTVERRIIASLAHALDAAEAEARRLGFTVHRAAKLLTEDAAQTATRLVDEVIAGPAGLYLWGGETTVALPPAPGRGGRNQHLALAAAMAMAGREDCWLLAAGTDGSDGPTEDAGALVDGATQQRGALQGFDAADCLARADAGSLLAASNDLINTGPTGTNVTDLVIALKINGAGA